MSTVSLSPIHETNDTCPLHEESHGDSFELSDAELQRRIAEIRDSWSPEERAQRAAMGEARRMKLARTLGMLDERACA